MWRISKGSLAALAFVLYCGCARHVNIPRPVAIGHTETGVASWYGDPYNGRKTASGEVYDMDRWTAAHRTLPFGTWVVVTNISNAKHVEVRITDRGPFVNGRIIDLSRAAAKQIDMFQSGTAQVRLRVIRPPSMQAAAQPYYAVQVASLTDRKEADALKRLLESKKHEARLTPRDSASGVRWRVLVGKESNMYDATLLATSLRAEYPDAFVVLVEGE